ncbi:MAG: enoyl-CoA hydratase [Rhodococcus sp. (in: high G+C Gram-positive bacteria)]|nr:MAG: enoyl-CoA hydratase [Rhodococcus sp. (in: high G+C Gram-positive bacteria)]
MTSTTPSLRKHSQEILLSTSDTGIIITHDGPIATITIDRPSVRNAFDLAAARSLMAAVDDIEQSKDTLVSIITGGDGNVFCAGADLRARERGEPRASIEPFGFAGFVRKPRTKPFIAAVNGYAVGGGFEIAMACDLVVAAPNAHFSLPEVKRGLIGAGDCLPFLAARIPHAMAAELALTGRQLTAQEALTLGLVNTVADDALKSARSFAEQIIANAPLAVQATLKLLNTLKSVVPAGYYAHADAVQAQLLGTADAAEGSRSFIEKRPPVWTGV